MSKIMLQIYVPSVMKWFDFLVSPQSTVFEVCSMITGILSDDLQGSISFDQSSVLCDYDEGFVYDLKPMLHQVGFENGKKLMII